MGALFYPVAFHFTDVPFQKSSPPFYSDSSSKIYNNINNDNRWKDERNREEIEQTGEEGRNGRRREEGVR